MKRLMFIILLFLIFFITPSHAQSPTDNEWSMVAANPQRTSWTPEEVRGELAVEWYRTIEPHIHTKTQVIAAQDKLFVSTARGLYAFDAANGDH